jgi:glucan phosphoethanolaminetransferase (alkaline phosphatase superfamily)
MSKRILLFNFIYYTIIIGLIRLGADDSSSSLGYGYFIIIFWIIAAVLLVFLLVKKIIHPKSVFEKIGIFTATPLLSLIGFAIIVAFKENASSEWDFNKNGNRYKVLTFDKDKNTGGKRIEYYRNIDTSSTKEDVWVRDSIWIYLSKTGDTIKKVKYKGGIEVK